MNIPLDNMPSFVCPISKLPLAACSAESLARLNEQIGAKKVQQVNGQVIVDQLEGALLRSDGVVAYRVVRGIPLLLPDAALHLEHHCGETTPLEAPISRRQ